MLKKFSILILVALMFSCVGGGSMYDTSLEMETQIATLAEQYEMWYQAANETTQAELKANIDPLFERADRLLDDWQIALSIGSDTDTLEEQLKILKTQIMLELAIILQEE
jgi:hypothetical protein